MKLCFHLTEFTSLTVSENLMLALYLPTSFNPDTHIMPSKLNCERNPQLMSAAHENPFYIRFKIPGNSFEIPMIHLDILRSFQISCNALI